MKVDFSVRSRQPEMIDSPDALSPSETEAMLRELAQVNRWLGGSEACLAPVRRWVANRPDRVRPGRLRVLDLGCGGGDIPRALVDWGRRSGIEIQVFALDFNAQACSFAQRRSEGYAEVRCIQADALKLPFASDSFDLALCSAFLHHFEDDRIIAILGGLSQAVSGLVIVNDLQRHPLAYWGFRLLSSLFSNSPAVRNDGPISVLRGFKRRELESILERLGAQGFTLRWRWAFRWTLCIPAPHG